MAVLALSGCAYTSRLTASSGPSRSEVTSFADAGPRLDAQGGEGPRIVVVEATEAVAQQLQGRLHRLQFSESLGNQAPPVFTLGPGDVLEVSVFEAPPAALFGSGFMDTRPGAGASSGGSTARGGGLGEQVVSEAGDIALPFAGVVQAAGKTPRQLERDIAERLQHLAHRPQVQVRVVRNAATTVTVVGEVNTSLRMPLTPRGEHLLDALAAAGGVRFPVDKVMLQVTRGPQVHALALDAIIRDPRQNVPLHPGDVVTALHEPLSFTALGAVVRNSEVPFEGQGITLNQALARVGGLDDNRADSRGVFIFRLEEPGSLGWLPPLQPGQTPAQGPRVPVIYRIDFRDPRSFFVSQQFPVQNHDLLFVSNALAADFQKFVNIIAGLGYPVLTLRSATH